VISVYVLARGYVTGLTFDTLQMWWRLGVSLNA